MSLLLKTLGLLRRARAVAMTLQLNFPTSLTSLTLSRLHRRVCHRIYRQPVLHLGNAGDLPGRPFGVPQFRVGPNRALQDGFMTGDLDGDPVGIELRAPTQRVGDP